MQITYAGDKSAEVSALEEGRGISTCWFALARDLTKNRSKLHRLTALT